MHLKGNAPLILTGTNGDSTSLEVQGIFPKLHVARKPQRGPGRVRLNQGLAHSVEQSFHLMQTSSYGSIFIDTLYSVSDNIILIRITANLILPRLS